MLSILRKFVRNAFRVFGYDIIRRPVLGDGSESKGNPRLPSALIPCMSVSELLKEEADIRLCEHTEIVGNVSLLELVIINALIRLRRPKVVFEIGTFDGRTTLNMANNGTEDQKIYTLDLPRHEIEQTSLSLDPEDRQFIDKAGSGARFMKHPAAKRIQQLYGDSATFDFSPYHASVDLMFIDGSHSYDYVLSDSRNAIKVVKTGGLIIWHDYHSPYWPGVTQAIEELFSNEERYRQIRHVHGTTLCIMEVTHS